MNRVLQPRISRRCYLFEAAFEWELTRETVHLPLSCLQGADPPARSAQVPPAQLTRHLIAASIYDKYSAGPSVVPFFTRWCFKMTSMIQT